MGVVAERGEGEWRVNVSNHLLVDYEPSALNDLVLFSP